MGIELEELGLTQERLTELMVNRLCDRVLDGEDCALESLLETELNKAVHSRIDVAVVALADTHVLPHIADYVEKVTLEKTNQWGEKRGETFTFIEYLVSRAEAYMLEKVNHSGEPKGADSYSWHGSQTRLAHMIDSHLHLSIERALKQVLAQANSNVAKGLEETVKLKLAEIQEKLKVTVKA